MGACVEARLPPALPDPGETGIPSASCTGLTYSLRVTPEYGPGDASDSDNGPQDGTVGCMTFLRGPFLERAAGRAVGRGGGQPPTSFPVRGARLSPVSFLSRAPGDALAPESRLGPCLSDERQAQCDSPGAFCLRVSPAPLRPEKPRRPAAPTARLGPPPFLSSQAAPCTLEGAGRKGGLLPPAGPQRRRGHEGQRGP